MPGHQLLRIRRPAACFVSNTAAGGHSAARRHRRAARSKEDQLASRRAISVSRRPSSVAPGASNPSQALQSEKGQMLVGEEVIAQPFTDTPTSGTRRANRLLQSRLHSSKHFSISRRFVNRVSIDRSGHGERR